MERDDERIRARAYDIWDRDGRPDGRDQEYWFRAERELSAPASGDAAGRVGSIAAGAAATSADTTGEVSVTAPAKKKANGSVKTAAAKAAPRKRRGAQPQSQF